MSSKLEIYPREDRRWSWRLIAPNGRVVATDGGQGYENEGDCARVAKAVARGAYRPLEVDVHKVDR